MGLLQKLVHLLKKLDPENVGWRARQTAAAEAIESATARQAATEAIARAFARDDDYGRKLYLIENCLYGVDIQPIAVQIAKLRFFIALVVDQPIDPALPNYGILPLPNLETKIVAANTLLGLRRGQLMLGSNEVRALERQLQQVRHDYFTARRYAEKKRLRQHDRALCARLFPWTPGQPLRDFPAIFEEESFTVTQGELRPVGWQQNPQTKRTMLARLVQAGMPLSEWTNGRIFNGIKTGLNDAFVVDSDTKERLIRAHKSSKEVLRPFLRGRDVKRWGVKFAEQWLLYLPWHFPLHRDSTITSASKKAEAEFEKLYPAIHAHLKGSKAELSKRDKAETGIRYEWYALARPRPEAMDHFNVPKVVAPAIEDGVDCAPDLTGFLSNDKTSIFIPPSVPFALSILNSPISWWIARQTFSSKQGGYFEFKPTYFSKLPIPAACAEEQQWCERLAEALIYLHRPEVAAGAGAAPVSLMAAWFEQWLNGLGYELFFRAELHARRLRLFEETARPANAPPTPTSSPSAPSNPSASSKARTRPLRRRKQKPWKTQPRTANHARCRQAESKTNPAHQVPAGARRPHRVFQPRGRAGLVPPAEARHQPVISSCRSSSFGTRMGAKLCFARRGVSPGGSRCALPADTPPTRSTASPARACRSGSFGTRTKH